MGFARRDLHVLPDGSVVKRDQFQDSAGLLKETSAQSRLAQLMARKQEIDYMATATALAGLSLDPDIEVEYRKLDLEIEETLKLVD
jgi:hypothetical protein